MSVPYEPVNVPALNLRAQYQTIRDEIEPVVRQVLETQGFVMGPEVSSLEAEISEYVGAAHSVGCASGTDALLLPLMAIDLAPGEEVVTTPYTFFATGGSIWRTGARPVFVDIEPDTYNIDPAKIEAAITPRTRAIIPVHLYGQTADMAPIREIADRHGLMVLEDAAQAIGAAYHGARAGTLGTAAAFSFYPSKNLGGFGDGGMVSTDDPVLAHRMARLRVHGMEPKYHHHEVGLNSRLDALQAAVLRVKLRHLDDWTTARREVADRYRSLFASHGLDELVKLPVERPGNFHVYNQFVVRVPGSIRDEFREFLVGRRIGTEIYYPIPLHLQVCFASLGYKLGDFPNSEAAARETIALPIYPELSEEEQRYVVGSMRKFLHEHAYASLSTDHRAA
ncbi:DegT/DnrJ/EryC1/StrS family aminotransferase [Paludisphaera borealis]|uniref:dTDP-3-amino-3,4,6-trideoxy-alpha-D-glucose transaminase n=1 Tax=Paludisphaera borealis TaxID=1387353 RepID=A0A1U7CTV7_9BACT|nr:DegT/DnrJ/EryC1/StrS family aminotransferase [Paludisphaera borealis]APW62374.1 dTDP-3-amino-3,4,6-trideoxy-alpha-D-glucose transaminase [Paludisphaera borealis]